MIATALLPVKPASFRFFASSFARGSLSPASRSRYNRPAVSPEIRSVSSDELDRFHFLVSYAFSSDRAPEARERMRHIEALGQDYALYQDGEMAACVRLFPMRMFLHGASIPLSGVSLVACLPEHRRKGYVGRLLRHVLGIMREQGQPLSSLWTPHPSLYRRYGWMVASDGYFYRFNPKEIAPADPEPAPPTPPPRGRGGPGRGRRAVRLRCLPQRAGAPHGRGRRHQARRGGVDRPGRRRLQGAAALSAQPRPGRRGRPLS